MKKSDFAGWYEVMTFSFEQTVKQKSYILFIILFSLFALFSSSAKTLFGKFQDSREKKAPFTKLLVYDETNLGLDFTDPLSDKKYDKVEITVHPERSFEQFKEDGEQEDADPDQKELAVRVTFEDGDFHITFVQGKNVDLSEMERQSLSGNFLDGFETARLNALEVTKEQNDFINSEIENKVSFLDENGEPKDDKKSDGISMQEYFITLFMICACMMVVNLGGSQIALSVVTEKSTKVIEYLMIHVRPMALIIGKILACLATVFLQLFTMLFCYFLSPMINNLLFHPTQTSSAGEVDEEAVMSFVRLLSSLKVEQALIAVAYVLLGVVFFGIIAGLAGASVSKMEELAEALTLYQALLVIGCYADLAFCVVQISGKGSRILTDVLCLIPVSGIFLLPSLLLSGKAGVLLTLGSFAVLILCVAVLFVFTANVYEAMIFYNGKRLKLMEICKLAKMKQGALERGRSENA